MDPKTKKVLEDQLGDLGGEIGRQAKERAQERGTLAGRVYQYAQDHGMVETGAKIVIVAGVSYTAGSFVPLVGHGIATLVTLGYAGKKLVYDPLLKKNKHK